ncbi:S-adenosyl-L-methionine-dependent methyltransferase [Stachybotrys elegans]|uniref:S-adenosyl-L-methionine-dependent methyltransferase n=1 Tax=Stachybotrys elegans TaxID=80388 RepID=A0A8K0SJ16_9HYPO|nr:S-adenosyl-L-methionine-dependent methyltransferase [Stachybotrys elegans]
MSTGSSPKEAAAETVEPTTDNLLPGDHWAQQYDDVDSVLGSEASESTASMSSSILEYRTIHGRTYHSERGDANYWGSNDEQQTESMDMNHHVLTLAIGGKLHLAPLGKDIKKAVDIGTGTGIWAIDFADEYPGCSVIGTDVSPIQPSWVPPNLQFQIDDCTQEWTFEDGSLDYVHMRYMTGSIVDWKALFREAFRCCAPGGYMESLESSPWFKSDDGTVTDTSAMGQWGKLFVEGSKKLGRTFTMVPDGLQREGMEEAGFVDIQEFDMKVPVGDWPKDPKLREIGRFARATLEQDVEGYVLYMATMQGWSKEEVTLYAAHFRRELRNTAIHGYFHMKVVWGKKPDA